MSSMSHASFMQDVKYANSCRIMQTIAIIGGVIAKFYICVNRVMHHIIYLQLVSPWYCWKVHGAVASYNVPVSAMLRSIKVFASAQSVAVK